jgi:hypothetical protein
MEVRYWGDVSAFERGTYRVPGRILHVSSGNLKHSLVL